MSYGVLLFVYATSALLYTYLVYPALLLIGRRTTQPVIKGFSGSLPTVSVIIPFHNEKRWVTSKAEKYTSVEISGRQDCKLLPCPTDRAMGLKSPEALSRSHPCH